MTRDNSWKNGVMSGGVPYEGKWDIPMSEKKALPNSGANKDTGKPWPEALKYTNTTAPAASPAAAPAAPVPAVSANSTLSQRNKTGEFGGDGGQDYSKRNMTRETGGDGGQDYQKK